jgi:hypothetical protein
MWSLRERMEYHVAEWWWNNRLNPNSAQSLARWLNSFNTLALSSFFFSFCSSLSKQARDV